jgi:nitrous oxide reductase accessory protein NosL
MRTGLAIALAAVLLGTSPGAPKPGPRDRCPVCGMFVARYPDWVASVRFRDGSHAFFDGAQDLFKFLLGLERYLPDRVPAEAVEVRVTDYYSLEPVDAREAWFVFGSDVLGPMGHELVPFARRAEAEEFLRDHRGRRILRFPEVDRATLKALE